MKAIVAVDETWGIGFRGGMLYHLPNDLKHFRDVTMNGVVVMGRNTLVSLPGSKPLPHRDNIVVSRYPTLPIAGTITTTLDALPEALLPYELEGRDIFLMGGGSIYRQLLPYCSEAIVTKIKKSTQEVDTFFPNLDTDTNWELLEESDIHSQHGIDYTFATYRNRNPKDIMDLALKEAK